MAGIPRQEKTNKGIVKEGKFGLLARIFNLVSETDLDDETRKEFDELENLCENDEDCKKVYEELMKFRNEIIRDKIRKFKELMGK